ncbi:DUF4931 domain-containing protein [Pseudalkalibacillus decolorationis]|uniref:DUF4931 domain-containing protein n=1 Tax=Pseudalkalibacillus decolorationis TaxID=163879 RepID=UPI00214821BC|nr:DUF4931 domain-containing protein [Pseudalkalibacillus decolorationis]
MKTETILHFNKAIASQKPNNIHQKRACPFCETEGLSEILDSRDSIILVKNKYPVLQDAFQTVLIETDECESELSEYPLEHLYKLIRFGTEKWMEMEQDSRFQSVLFFKNHGPLSGGSVRHPHMQIVGLNNTDYRDNLKEDYFIGNEIHSSNGVQLNLSTKPMIGFTEFNIILTNLNDIEQASKYIQNVLHYVLNYFNGRGCSSYNLFFYHWLGKIFIKIVPRYATTPLYVGYGLRQVFSNPQDLIEDIHKNISF